MRVKQTAKQPTSRYGIRLRFWVGFTWHQQLIFVGHTGADSFSFRANDGPLNSATATVSISVQAPSSVPAVPSALATAAISQTQINLSWTDNSSNEDGFKIERSTDNRTFTQIGTVGAGIGTFNSTGLSANKTYYYRVRAYNVLGDSAYSNTASAKTLK